MKQLTGEILLWVGAFLEIMIVPVAVRTPYHVESAIAAMPNNYEALPHTCSVHTCETPMRVTEDGRIRATGKSAPVAVLLKAGRKVSPVVPK